MTLTAHRLDDRLTIEEIYSIVDEGTHLTFDYMLNTFYAAMIAALGLASDSAPTVVSKKQCFRIIFFNPGCLDADLSSDGTNHGADLCRRGARLGATETLLAE